MECFRCQTCGNLDDVDPGVIYLPDGSFNCNNCGQCRCSVCGKSTEESAILTGDKAYCKPCFRCDNCQEEIHNLKYARTPLGIFCMECHDAEMKRRRAKGRGKRTRLLQRESLPQPVDKDLPRLPTDEISKFLDFKKCLSTTTLLDPAHFEVGQSSNFSQGSIGIAL